MAVDINPELLFFCKDLPNQWAGFQSKMNLLPALDLAEIRIIIILVV